MWMLPVQSQSWISEFILILFIVFLLLYLSSVLGNGLIITLICVDTHLHTPMYFFLCILSLLDTCYITTTMPQMLVHLLAHSQTISFAGCWLQMYVFGALAMTESGTWVVGFIFSLMHTFFTMWLPYCGPNKVNHYFCEGPSVCSLACMDTHLIEMVDLVMSVFVVVVPISFIVIKSTQARCKAFSTCASHLTVVILFYVPATYIYMKPNSSYSPERDKQISLFYNVFTALLNPVVYSLRNKDIKRAFLKVMGHGSMDW
uniref:G-protein coupled receptors family 1 profile domain-containing protein n=1 Tax=Nannospalax galili TaxID=1026970 RepID=A0A8C6QGE2_NANGA